MSKQQLAAILEMSAQNPIPANAGNASMGRGYVSYTPSFTHSAFRSR